MSASVAIILNGISRKKARFYRDVLPVLKKNLDVHVFETRHAGHAVTLGREAVSSGHAFVVAAGGDGTLNQVINGALSSGLPTPVFGLIPLGTGNDFAKLTGLTQDPNRLIQLIGENQPVKIDIGKISCCDHENNETTRYFINACSLGMGPAVVAKLARSKRLLGPFLTYWTAITSAFFTHRPEEIQCGTPEWYWKGKIRVLVVANGQSFGNGLYIAPDGSPNDGKFNTFIAGEIPLFRFLQLQQMLKKKARVTDPLIHYHQAQRLELSAPQPCAMETEGEHAGYLPAGIEIIPSAIRFLK